MSSLHAGWSFGGVIGAGFAAALAGLGVDPRVTVVTRSVAAAARSSSTCLRRIGEGSAAEGEEAPRFTLPSRGVLLLAILALLVMITEGAMADWGGIYLRDLGVEAAVAALAFAVFSAGMTTGRVVGDWVTHRIGPVATLRWGALLTGDPARGPAARRLAGRRARSAGSRSGVGVANGVPLMFSAAGRQPDVPSGPGHRRRVVARLARLPDRPAVHRLPRRRRHAAVGAGHADPRRRRGVRARAARRRPDRAGVVDPPPAGRASACPSRDRGMAGDA